jgi:hypothetical protein
MTPEQVDLEVMGFRRRLFAAMDAYRSSALYAVVRADIDALTCLYELAPERKQPKILALLERFEALARTLVN